MLQPVVVRPGLCSVTLRGEPPHRVLEVAAASGLPAVEWGGDVHVPPGDVRLARRVRDLTAGAGLRCASYGSYHRPGVSAPDAFSLVLASATALGAPRIRIWAGAGGSAGAGAADRRAVARQTRAAADRAADAGVQLAFEYHAGTLTDTPRSTLDLLDDVDRPNVATYWQPPVGMPDGAALEDLAQVLDRVAAVHVFSWWPHQERRPLSARAALWRSVLAALHRRGAHVDALLEFVPDDDVSLVPAEARAVTALLQEATAPALPGGASSRSTADPAQGRPR